MHLPSRHCEKQAFCSAEGYTYNADQDSEEQTPVQMYGSIRIHTHTHTKLISFASKCLFDAFCSLLVRFAWHFYNRNIYIRALIGFQNVKFND